MKTFEFNIDKKVSVWHRSHYTVKAKTKKEAIKLMKEEFESNNYPEEGEETVNGITFLVNEILYETEEELTPKDNDMQPTSELYEKNSLRPIITNVNS